MCSAGGRERCVGQISWTTLLHRINNMFLSSFMLKEKEEKTAGNTRAYRVVCVILSLICLILLIAVIFLGTKGEYQQLRPRRDGTCLPRCSRCSFPFLNSTHFSISLPAAALPACPSSSAVPSTCTKQTCKTLYSFKGELQEECRVSPTGGKTPQKVLKRQSPRAERELGLLVSVNLTSSFSITG